MSSSVIAYETGEVYDLGAAPDVRATFRAKPVPPARTGVLTDPTLVTFTVKINGTLTDTFQTGDPEVTNPSVGLWILQLDALTVPGEYCIKAVGSGALSAARRLYFRVQPDC